MMQIRLRLTMVEAEPCHIDAITRDSTLPPPVVSATLAMLELKGFIKQVGGMQYVLARWPRIPYAYPWLLTGTAHVAGCLR